jgi:hypothetical protein
MRRTALLVTGVAARFLVPRPGRVADTDRTSGSEVRSPYVRFACHNREPRVVAVENSNA